MREKERGRKGRKGKQNTLLGEKTQNRYCYKEGWDGCLYVI
jgi:hypothetical protein